MNTKDFPKEEDTEMDLLEVLSWVNNVADRSPELGRNLIKVNTIFGVMVTNGQYRQSGDIILVPNRQKGLWSESCCDSRGTSVTDIENKVIEVLFLSKVMNKQLE